MKMRTILCAVVALFLAGFASAPATAQSQQCWPGDAGSTLCQPPPKIIFRGTGTQKTPPLLPVACTTDEAYGLMTGPGVSFWFTYYQRWRNGGVADMEPVIRTRCITKQRVFPGVRLGFWVDCIDPKDGRVYRYWWETDPITASQNPARADGTWPMVLKRKVLVSEL